MAKPSTASRRIGLMGLAVAGALAGSAGGAAAQYYYDYYDEVPVAPYPPAYGYGYRYTYGYRDAPRIAEPVTQRDIRRMAAERYGFVRIDRLYRTEESFVVDGMRANGQRQRLVLDAFAGNLIRRIPLHNGQPGPEPDLARIDPQQEREAPRPRLVPKPPQRPADLKPPGQASAPATAVPPAPAAPPAPDKAPDKAPEPQPPVEASAPATQAPPAAAAPAAPSPGPVNPDSGAEKPKLVNPQDVRGAGEAERKPPLSSPAPPASAEATVPLAPVQGQDSGTAKPKPETPIAPVAPLE